MKTPQIQFVSVSAHDVRPEAQLHGPEQKSTGVDTGVDTGDDTGVDTGVDAGVGAGVGAGVDVDTNAMPQA